MGCDIHAYVEYYTTGAERTHWRSWGSRINPGRDYQIFAKLAGVRADDKDEKMIPARGIPDDMSLTAKWDYQLYVSDDHTGDDWTSTAKAEGWVQSGHSQWLDEAKTRVSHPDWHSPSWCNTSEFRLVLEVPARWDAEASWWALLASMEELERRGCMARLVFWFDN